MTVQSNEDLPRSAADEAAASFAGSLDRGSIDGKESEAPIAVARPASGYKAAEGPQVNCPCFPGCGADHTDGMPPISIAGKYTPQIRFCQRTNCELFARTGCGACRGRSSFRGRDWSTKPAAMSPAPRTPGSVSLSPRKRSPRVAAVSGLRAQKSPAFSAETCRWATVPRRPGVSWSLCVPG